MAQGDDAAAEPLFERALAILETQLGRHPSVARVLYDLSALTYKKGHHARAAQQLERAVAIFDETVGPRHDATANTLVRLANVRGALGEYASAVDAVERAIKIWGELQPGRDLIILPENVELLLSRLRKLKAEQHETS